MSVDQQRLAEAYSELYFPFKKSECLCFTGHRMIPSSIRGKIEKLLDISVLEAFETGKRVFISGGALGFDTLAALAVIRLKRKHPEVKLLIAVPCRTQASRWTFRDRETYHALLAQADEVIYISDEYFPGCMQKRNRFLVDHADQCVCFLNSCRGGTWYTVSYAYDQGIIIQNLALEL